MKSHVTRVTAATLLSVNEGVDLLTHMVSLANADAIQKFHITPAGANSNTEHADAGSDNKLLQQD